MINHWRYAVLEITAPVSSDNQQSLSVESQDEVNADEESEGGEINQTIIDLIKRLDKGEGVDFDSILNNAAARGFDRDSAESALDDLSDDGEIHEPRFGWFKITE